MNGQPYLIFLDLDSTLLTRKKRIPFWTKHHLRKLARRGHYIVIATGRPFQGAYTFYQKLHIKNMPLVVNNGAAIMKPCLSTYKYDLMVAHQIPQKLIIDLYNECSEFLLAAMASSLDSIYIKNSSYIPFWIIHRHPNIAYIEGELNEIIAEDIINISFQVNALLHDDFLKVISQPKYASLLFHNWRLIDGKTYSYEINLKTATKGNALIYLRDLWGIQPQNTIAFGDNENDISMIIAAHHGIAMINGSELIKKQTNKITKKTNDKSGVLHYLRKIKF